MGDLNESSSSSALAPLYVSGDHIYSAFVDFIITYPKSRWTKVSANYVNCGKLSDHDPIVAVISSN